MRGFPSTNCQEQQQQQRLPRPPKNCSYSCSTVSPSHVRRHSAPPPPPLCDISYVSLQSSPSSAVLLPVPSHSATCFSSLRVPFHLCLTGTTVRSLFARGEWRRWCRCWTPFLPSFLPSLDLPRSDTCRFPNPLHTHSWPISPQLAFLVLPAFRDKPQSFL